MKILIVDDDEAVRALVVSFLTLNGFDVVEAADGAEGIKSVAQERPDLIIMDINMPGMNGFEATQQLKADPQTKSIPILMQTAENTQASYDEIYDAGADGYLAKPIKFDVLLTRLNEFPNGGADV